ncbi:MAG: NADH-quinone oxidoreductase subunit NuoE [Candidatus Ozemobacteraceae bacterium]
MPCSLTESKIKEKIVEICKEFGNDPEELIAILHKAQGHFGFLPSEVQHAIAEELRIPVSKVFGVVTFYSYFSTKPKGKYQISICLGTACYVQGAEKVLQEFEKKLQIKNGQTTPNGKFSLNTLRCIGACGLAPVVMVGEKVYGSVKPDGVDAIIKEYPE